MENQLIIQVHGVEKKVELPKFGEVTVVMIEGKVKHINVTEKKIM